MTGQVFYEALSRRIARAAYAEGVVLGQEVARKNGVWSAEDIARNDAIRERYENSDRAASLALAEAGIPGHRFLDGRSRSPGDGTYNYVIYDDQHVDVLEFEQGGKGPAARSPYRLAE